MSFGHKYKIIVPTVVTVLLLDRISKALTMSGLVPGESVGVIGGYFDLTYVQNTGAAFGVFSMMDAAYRVPFFALVTLAALGLMLYLIHKAGPGELLLVFSLSLLVGGALGNMADRLMYGYVVDFVDWHIGARHWPAFNVADIAISVGVALMGFNLLFGKTPAIEEGKEVSDA